mmetsp:Transcript_31889/g.93710  ORF Transcript_31889/g.93710 Transcript_31889/m.93710 type:complete len:331 (+) Transcript_31889:2125-3117(+)
MLLGIDLANVLDHHLLGRLALLGSDALAVRGRELEHPIDDGLVLGGVVLELVDGQSGGPVPLVQIHQHLLLQFVLPVIDDDGVVVPVEAVDEGLDRRLVQMADVAGRLAGLLAEHHELRIDEAEAVDDDLALDGLDGIDDEGDGAGIQGLEAGLGVDVGRAQPAAEAGMGVVPTHHHLTAAGLLQHVEHLGLVDGIDGLDADAGARLGHAEHVDAVDGVVVDELAEHEAHDLHGDAGPAVLEHLEEGEGRHVDLFGGVGSRGVGVHTAAHPAAGHPPHELLDTVHVFLLLCCGVLFGGVFWVGWKLSAAFWNQILIYPSAMDTMQLYTEA